MTNLWDRHGQRRVFSIGGALLAPGSLAILSTLLALGVR
jgi:hypothetical protein